MKLINKEGWEATVKANQDGYGSAVIRYAERWADLMKKKISEGCTLADIADRTSHEADTEGITGFMYGCAVSILAQVWEHGELLRDWHNRSYGYQGDGTVNPAILTIK